VLGSFPPSLGLKRSKSTQSSGADTVIESGSSLRAVCVRKHPTLANPGLGRGTLGSLNALNGSACPGHPPYQCENGTGWNSEENPVRGFWQWNQTHKPEAMKFYTMHDLAKTYWSDSPRSGPRQWENHDPSDCPKCVRRERAGAAN